MDRENNKQITLPGLPPLPKSLSSATGATSNNSSPLNHQQYAVLEHELFLGASSSNSGLRNNRQSHRHGSLSSTQESLSDRESLHSRASSSPHSNHAQMHTNAEQVAGTATLDTQLAILRREMYGLRQLDLSLLSQLWALNESIQGFRVFLQEQETLSPPSPSSPTPSENNSLTSEADEDISSFAQLPTQLPTNTTTLMLANASVSTASHASSSSNSGASGTSSATSSMSKHGMPPPPTQKSTAHPQLPRILQQRMRRAPPPPPPNSGKTLAAANKNATLLQTRNV